MLHERIERNIIDGAGMDFALVFMLKLCYLDIDCCALPCVGMESNAAPEMQEVSAHELE